MYRQVINTDSITLGLRNVRIVSMAGPEADDLVDDGVVLVENGRIVWCGKRDAIPNEKNVDQWIDGEDGLLTPGLIDCHTHLVYAGNRAEEFERRLNGVSYAEISKRGGGIMSTVRATRAASEDELVKLSEPRLRSLIDHGVTSVEIKSGYGLNAETEIRMLRAATTLCKRHNVSLQRTLLAAHALPEEFGGRSDAYIDLVCNEILPQAIEAGVVDAVDAFCEHLGFTAAQVERVFQRAKDFDLPLKIHAEQLSDSGGSLLAARYQALSADHLEYLSAEDVAAMADAGTVAVLLPGAFYVLKETRMPPLDSLRAHNVPIALGTDANPGSSPVFSPLITMNMACTLFGMTPREALEGFTINGARALGWEQQVGSIAVGKRADLALWRCEHPAELSYHIGLNACIGTMRSGIWYPRPC